MKRGQAHPAPAPVATNTANPATEKAPAIELRLEQGYIICRCGDAFAVYEMLWQNRHGDPHKQLVLRECVPIPRQFEREAFGDRG